MTDEFEDLVRSAGRGLSTTSELPTYHDAWRRGRRRRVVKRSALAAAGALALVVAFSADLGRLPGGNSVEVDDVASESQPVPAPADAVFEATATPVPTTAPVVAADPEIATSDDVTVDPEVTSPDEAQPDEPPPAPTTPAATPTPAVSAPVPAPTAAAPAPTPAPTVASPATATPTPLPRVDPPPIATVDPSAVQVAPPVEPTVDRDPTQVDTDDGDPNDEDGTAAASQTPVPTPELAFTTQPPADASLRADAPSVGGAQPCDLDGDGEPDARCEVLVEYPCKSADDQRPGFIVADVDGDGETDRCLPDVATTCDLDGDALGDVPCIIRVQENLATTGP